uniref:Uncharacterized protein n=1 Tax=Exiguobacterium arabatum TaxID=518693 RepID=B2G3I6_9BACL|nr:DUF5626 family protein [Exiguobacterium arabatum]CAQ35228.1 hypothetical protein [Exiguobacterium arabatum]
MKKIVGGLMIPVLTLSLTTGIGSVQASENQSSVEKATEVKGNINIPAEEIVSLKEFLAIYNVDVVTQEKLINKLENGEIWDSLKPNVEPIDFIQNSDKAGNIEQIEIYADGSVAATTIEPTTVETFEATPSVPGMIQPMTVTPGTVTGGSGYKAYKKAQVRKNIGVADAYFYADFTLVQGGMDFIQRVYDYKLVGKGGTTTFTGLKITRAKETQDYKASAKLDFNFVAYDGLGSVSCWLKLFVGKDSYSSAYSY